MRWRLATIVFLVWVSAAGAATNGPALFASPEAPIETAADSLEYAQDGAILKATGHVVITNGATRLTADRVTVKLDSRETWANGNVVLTQGSNTWTGDRLYCNLASGLISGDGQSQMTANPFHGFIRGGFRKLNDTITGDDATVTTCNLSYPDWHYYLQASHATLVQNNSICVKHVFFYLAGIPVMYFPYWERAAGGNGIGFVPGYSSSMGAYMLGSYSYGISDTLRGSTRLDYRTRRGPALGQNLDWAASNRTWAGGIQLYGTIDRDPFIDRNPASVIDDNRFRMLLFHDQSLNDRTRLLARLNYLSDSYMLDDFFRAEYRIEPQPDNFASLTYRNDSYTAGLLIRPRLNDFYDAVTRIPEAQFECPLQQVKGMPLYYESQTRAGYMEKLWTAEITNSSYSAFRFDTRQGLSTPVKVSFLNFVPRVAVRATYYSSTPETDIDTSDGGSATRTMLEAGAQLSFKMFKVYSEASGKNGGLRHVAEPYLNYTYIPEPDIGPGDLFSFDEVDALVGQNQLRLGIRNKLQVKKNSQPFDLINIDTWSDGNFNSGDSESTFNFLYMDARTRPWDKVGLDFDGKFSLAGGDPEELNVHLILTAAGAISTDMEYRYRRDLSSLISGKFTYSPSALWSYTYQTRYEFEDSRLEEHSLWLQRNYDCMSVALGLNQIPAYTLSDGSEHESEFQVMFKIWLKAFPKFGVAID
ncbi:MAG: LPS assembly protein LptD [bacterium]